MLGGKTESGRGRDRGRTERERERAAAAVWWRTHTQKKIHKPSAKGEKFHKPISPLLPDFPPTLSHTRA